MEKHRYKFVASKMVLLVLILFCIPDLLVAQTQLKKWYIGSKMVDMTTNPPTVDTNTLAGSIYYGANIMYDDQGQILFYADYAHVYNKVNTVVDNMVVPPCPANDDHSAEMVIVPFINNNTCLKRWYIFYSQYRCRQDSLETPSTYYKVYGKVVSYDVPTKTITSTDIKDANGKAVVLSLTSDIYGYNNADGCNYTMSLAASNIFNQKRFLFIVGRSGVRKITISSNADSTNNYGLSASTIIYNDPLYSYPTYEVDLFENASSPAWNGSKKLAWGSNGYSDSRFFVIGLDSNGNWDSTKQSFSTSRVSAALRGVEFSDNGNKLFFSDGDSIFVGDLINHTKHSISGTNNYGMSQLERAYNGLIYTSSSTTSKIIGINQSTETIDAGSALTTTVQQLYGVQRLLPDQIDGYNYDKDGYYHPDILNGSYNNTATWTPISNPIKANSYVVRVKDSLVFNSGANITIADLTIEFGNNAKMVIKPGARVNLVNCTLRGNDNCPLLWNGITVDGTQSSNAELLLYGILGIYSGSVMIQDAKNGITMNGTHVGSSQILDGNFSGNVNDIVLNGTPGFYIGGCHFDGSVPLKDQSYGSNYGYIDGKKRSYAAVSIINATSTFSLTTDTIQNYQLGILASNADFSISGSLMSNIKFYCINADATKNTKNLTIQTNGFKDSKAGLRIANGYTASVFGNTFTNITDGFAIQWRDNPNRNFVMGDVNDTTKKNTFNACNWDAVNLYYNSGSQTQISVFRNEFLNQTYAKAINIEEPVNVDSTFASFKLLNVNRNKITNLGKGINLTNIQGVNTWDSRRQKPKKAFSSHTIDSNQIGFNNSYSPYVYGIQMNGGGRLNIWDNQISSNSSGSWENSAINLADAPNMLVNGNICSAGSGLRASAMMINSNYYCNTMTNCVNGIKLGNAHVLRADNSTHGVAGTGSTSDARQNAMNGTFAWGADMYLSNLDQNCQNNLWVFPTGTRPQIQYVFPAYCNNIDAGSATYNFCNTFTVGTDTAYNQGGNFTVTSSDNTVIWKRKYYQQQAYIRGESTQASGDATVVALINIEQLIASRSFSSALTSLNSWSTGANQIATDYKNVYKALVNKYIRDTGTYTSTEISTLTAVAQKNPMTNSPAAYCARAILWNEFLTEFIDTPDKFYPNIAGYVAPTCGTPLFNQLVYLEKQGAGAVNYNVFTSTDGKFIFYGDSLKNITDTTSLYRIVASYGGNYQYSTYKTIANLAYGSYNYLTCPFGKTGNSTGLDEQIKNGNSAIVYPNPANAELIIQSTLPVSSVRLNNMIGQVVLEVPFNSSLNVSNAPTGVYFIELLDKKGGILHKQKLSILH